MSDQQSQDQTKSAIERQLGGRPSSVLIRLLVLSILVGAILYFAGLNPIRLIDGIRALFTSLLGSGFDAVVRIGEFALYGAVIVVPIWLIGRLFASRKS